MVNDDVFVKKQDFDSTVFGLTTFNNVEFGKARGLMSLGDKRILLDGKFSINVVNGAKFGKEVHFQVYGLKSRVEGRLHDSWCRSEIYFSLDDLDNLIKSLLELKKCTGE